MNARQSNYCLQFGNGDDDRFEALLNAVANLFEDRDVDLDEAMSLSASLMAWTLHQHEGSLGGKLEALDFVAREMRNLLLRNARHERG